MTIHILMLYLLLNCLKFFQFPLSFSESQEFLGVSLNFERIISIWIHKIVEIPMRNLGQDHLGQFQVLLVDMFMQLRHLEPVSIRLWVDTTHWSTTKTALSRWHIGIGSTNFRIGVQPKPEIAGLLRIASPMWTQ